jgi:hypothetical protein
VILKIPGPHSAGETWRFTGKIMLKKNSYIAVVIEPNFIAL